MVGPSGQPPSKLPRLSTEDANLLHNMTPEPGELEIDIAYNTDGSDHDSELELLSHHESDDQMFDDEDIEPDDNNHYTEAELHDLKADDDVIKEIIENVGTVDDFELSNLKKSVLTLTTGERLFCIYLCSLSIDKLLNAIRYNETDDDVLLDLLCITVPSQTNGFLFVLQSCFVECELWSSSCSEFTSVLDFFSQTSAKCRIGNRKTLEDIGKQYFDYFCGDLVDDSTVSTAYLKSRLQQLMRTMQIDHNAVLDCFSRKINTMTDNEDVRKSVKLKRDPIPAAVSDSINTLEDLLAYSNEMEDDDTQLSQSQCAVKANRIYNSKIKTVSKKMADDNSAIIVWRGNALETDAIAEFQKAKIDKTNFRDITDRLHKKNFTTFEEASNELNSSMSTFYAITTTLSKSCKISIAAARKWANDIVQINNRSALLFLKQRHREDSLIPTGPRAESSMSNHSSGLTEVNIKETQLAQFYPTPGDLKTVMRQSLIDERFIALPPDWKCKDISLPAGIFREHYNLNEKTKNVLLVIFGEDNCLKFEESISEFNAFNSAFDRLAKSGLWAMESCNKVIRGVTCHNVMYVVLTMGRKASLHDIYTQILWFLKQQGVALEDCLLEYFNTEKDFHQCYKAINDIKVESEGGFIGAIDVDLRKKLKINDNQLAQEQGFRIIAQYFQDNGIISTHAAIRCIAEANNLSNWTEENRQFQEAVNAVMCSANLAVNTVKHTMWWNSELKKSRSPFLSTNLGFLSFKIADKLFRKINKISDHLLNPNVDILDWDEEEMGPIKYKGTFLQPDILNLIQEMRTQPTDLLYVLKSNEINPAAFFNKICEHLVLAGRRDRTLLFSGPKKAGKSIIAGALLKTFDGVRLALDMGCGREFNVAESATDNIALALLEDVSFQTMKNFVDKSLRPLLDGDEVVTNPKMRSTSKGTWRSCLITTNVDVDSDSDDEKQFKNSFSLKHSKVLSKRFQAIKFRRDLSKADMKLFVSDINEDDVIALFWRYCLFPQCNSLVGGPRCHMSPCSSDASCLESHHFHCPLVREVLSNVDRSIERKYTFDSTYTSVDEHVELVDKKHLSLVFDIKKIDELSECFLRFYQCTDKEIMACRSESAHSEKKVLASKLRHFLEYVWTPLCFASTFMRGKYVGIEKSTWLRNVLNHHLFKPFQVQNESILVMSDMLNRELLCEIGLDNLLCTLKTDWCHDKHPRVKLWLDILSDKSVSLDVIISRWKKLLGNDRKLLYIHSKAFLTATAHKKRFRKGTIVRCIEKFTTDSSDSSLFAYLIGKRCIVANPNESISSINDIDLSFFD